MNEPTQSPAYSLDEQIGFLLRLATQRHTVIFQDMISDGLTPPQFATLMRIAEQGEVSQNQLGRLAAIDIATTKGIIDRLKAKNLVKSRADASDKRRLLLSLTSEAQSMIKELAQVGRRISHETLAPLNPEEQAQLISLLRKIT